MLDITPYSALGSPSFSGDLLDRKRILIADDHPEFLGDLRSLLISEYDVAGAVQDGRALTEAAQNLAPDLIISDISMPVMSGFEAAARILALRLEAKIIFLTIQSSTAYVAKARSLGAKGYVLKTHATEQLPIAVSKVLAGETFVSPELGCAL